VRRGNWAQVEEATRNYMEAEGPKKQKRKKNKRKEKLRGLEERFHGLWFI
jgi:hypothetical protein